MSIARAEGKRRRSLTTSYENRLTIRADARGNQNPAGCRASKPFGGRGVGCQRGAQVWSRRIVL